MSEFLKEVISYCSVLYELEYESGCYPTAGLHKQLWSVHCSLRQQEKGVSLTDTVPLQLTLQPQ